MTAAFAVSCFFAWQDEYTSAEWGGQEIIRLGIRSSDQAMQISQLEGQLAQKDRPILLTQAPDPEIRKLLQRQEVELAKIKTELPSPKKKALQLSKDMLSFASTVLKNQPNPPMPLRSQTQEQYTSQMNQFQQGYLQWMNGIAGEYGRQFAVRVASLEDDIKAAGLDDTIAECQFSNGNTFGLQRCAALIGALAD